MAETQTFRWNGDQLPQQGAVTRSLNGGIQYVNKGVRRARRAQRRQEAESRNAQTSPENRRQFARDYGYPRNSARIAAGLHF